MSEGDVFGVKILRPTPEDLVKLGTLGTNDKLVQAVMTSNLPILQVYKALPPEELLNRIRRDYWEARLPK